MPEKLSGHCAIRDWDAIYVIGSSQFQPYLKVFLFNITTSTWTTLMKTTLDLNTIPNARQYFACSLNADKSKILISGGISQENRATLNDFYSFTVKTKSWEKLGNSLKPRSGHVMTLYRNLTTIMGGLCSNNTALGSMESFIDGAFWHQLNETLTKRKNFRVTQVPTSFLPPA